MRVLLVLLLVMSCTPKRGTEFVAPCFTSSRALLPVALDEARLRNYEIAAIDQSATGVAFLALPPAGTNVHTALLVQLWNTPVRTNSRRVVGAAPTNVVVTPLAFQDGRELPRERVPPLARSQAEALTFAIFDRARVERPIQ